MSDFNEVITGLRLEKRTRRHFSVSDEKRPFAEADALAHGEKGAWVRRQGLYAGQLSNWRKDLAEHGGRAWRHPSPGGKAADPRDKELERLKKANTRLEQRAYVAEQLGDFQNKVLHLFDRDKEGDRS